MTSRFPRLRQQKTCRVGYETRLHGRSRLRLVASAACNPRIMLATPDSYAHGGKLVAAQGFVGHVVSVTGFGCLQHKNASLAYQGFLQRGGLEYDTMQGAGIETTETWRRNLGCFKFPAAKLR